MARRATFYAPVAQKALRTQAASSSDLSPAEARAANCARHRPQVIRWMKALLLMGVACWVAQNVPSSGGFFQRRRSEQSSGVPVLTLLQEHRELAHALLALLLLAVGASASVAVVVESLRCMRVVHAQALQHTLTWFDRLRHAVPLAVAACYCETLAAGSFLFQKLAIFFCLAALLTAGRLTIERVLVLSAAKRQYGDAIAENLVLRAGLRRLVWACDADDDVLEQKRKVSLLHKTTESMAFEDMADQVLFPQSMVEETPEQKDMFEILSVLDCTQVTLRNYQKPDFMTTATNEAEALFEKILDNSPNDLDDLNSEELARFMPQENVEAFWRLLAKGEECLGQKDFCHAVAECADSFGTSAASIEDFYTVQMGIIGYAAYLQHVILLAMFLHLIAPEWARAMGLFCSSILLSSSFVFGSSLREVYESILLVTAVRPFDVGDRIDAGMGDGAVLVTRIRLLTTEALTSTNKCLILKNSSLYQKEALKNFRRSSEALVDIDVRLASSSVTKQALEGTVDFLRNWVSENERSWHPVVASFNRFDDKWHIQETIVHCFRLKHRRAWQEVEEIRNSASAVIYPLMEEMSRLGLVVDLPIRTVRLDGALAELPGTCATASLGELGDDDQV